MFHLLLLQVHHCLLAVQRYVRPPLRHVRQADRLQGVLHLQQRAQLHRRHRRELVAYFSAFLLIRTLQVQVTKTRPLTVTHVVEDHKGALVADEIVAQVQNLHLLQHGVVVRIVQLLKARVVHAIAAQIKASQRRQTRPLQDRCQHLDALLFEAVLRKAQRLQHLEWRVHDSPSNVLQTLYIQTAVVQS